MKNKFSLNHLWKKLTLQFFLHPIQSLILTLLVIAGAWFRLHALAQTLTFQADQGRDALIVAAIFKEHDLVFIGPTTSVGNMYLGPFYYYFMLPFLWLSYPSPLGPAYGVALVNILGIILMYTCGRHLVGRKAALWGSFFYAFSYLEILYSRFSWNPNLSAVMTLLTLYYLDRACRHSSRYWPVVALLCGLLIQLHYVNLIIVGVVGLFWLGTLWEHRRDQKWLQNQHFLSSSLIALATFALTLVPLLLFDWKHGWFNVQSFTHIFVSDSFTSNHSLLATLLTAIGNIPGRLTHFIARLTLPGLHPYNWRLAFGIAVCMLYFYLVYQTNRARSHYYFGHRILAVCLLVSVFLMSFYTQSVFDHYLLFFLPILFWILGSLLTDIVLPRPLRLPVALVVICGYLVSNYHHDFFQGPGCTLACYQQSAQAIADHLPPEDSYNLALHVDTGDSAALNYRFLVQGLRPNLVDNAHSDQADHLFIIDEKGVKDIFDTPNFEVITYPSRIVREIIKPEHGQVTIYHLERDHE